MRLSVATSETHNVILAGLVLIFFIRSDALVRFIFSPLVIGISFELKFFPADDWTWRKSAAYRSSRGVICRRRIRFPGGGELGSYRRQNRLRCGPTVDPR